jgi:hypothetical protein
VGRTIAAPEGGKAVTSGRLFRFWSGAGRSYVSVKISRLAHEGLRFGDLEWLHQDE